MNTLGDALKDAYAADERSARGLALGSHRTIVAIRRRRTAHAAGTGTAAAVAIGALGAVWWLGPGGREFAPGQPAPSTQCTDAQLYLPANPDALGDSDFLYRAYVDLRQDSPTHGVVVVRKDGTLVRVEPGADGSYTYLGSPNSFADTPDDFRYQPLVLNNFAWGGGGGVWDGVSPVTRDYEWTVEVPAGAPAGVDTAQLSSSLRVAMGLGGSGYDSSFVPDGAVTDVIITTTAGETEVSRVAYGGPSNTQDTSKDVASIALRVSNLPGGDTYTLTATHHSIDPALTACASSTSASVSATVTGTPSPAATGVLPGSSPDPEISQGGVPEVLAGPESEVFACGELLPVALEGKLGLDVTWASGPQPIAIGLQDTFDLGEGGIVATGELPQREPEHGELQSFNWASSGTEGKDSLALYLAAVAVSDGRIVGLVNVSEDPGPTETFNFNGPGSEPAMEKVSMGIKDVDGRMQPCPGYVDSELEGATTVALLGTGGVGGPYTFAWTTVSRP